ncbi:hypothetical protein MNV49_004605 [Pseudohyphozyma bogoriensis]|nr:hypothetical protein MNV49_004605 [Pseudohyphozyma bogoriensis]
MPMARRPSTGSPSLFYIKGADSDDEDRRPLSKKTDLPLYAGGGKQRASGRSWAGKKYSKSQWAVMVTVVVLGAWFYFTPADIGRTGDVGAAGGARGASKDAMASPTRAASKPPKRPRPPPKAPGLPPDVVDVNVWPASTLTLPRPPSTERFLAYSPHSGYHNQRISLENALTLAFMLDRTLLLPPVWLGHAIPYIHFEKLQRRLQLASKVGLEQCAVVGEGGSSDPIPRECEGYYDWSLVHWDFLVDLDESRKVVPMRDRWNHTDAWLVEDLGLRPISKKTGVSPDVYQLRDAKLYDFRFYDSPEDQEPVGKFEARIDVAQLQKETEDYKLLHLGSMFGTTRFHIQEEANFNARSTFRKSMVFKNTLLDEITSEIRDRLGGVGSYYGLHLRVGDGIFQTMAEEHMDGVWQNLCVSKMGVTQEVCDEVVQASWTKQGRGKKNLKRGEGSNPGDGVVEVDSLPNAKRAGGSRQGAFNHDPLPSLPVITSRSTSPLDSSMSCRRPLHTESHLLPFNTPLFIATDSRMPTSDLHLALFFDAFPCTFILSDFPSSSPVNTQPVEGLGRLTGLRNQDDKVPLAQFLYPQLDAQIAAYGRDLIGTPQSTYSRFAVDVLYQYYQFVPPFLLDLWVDDAFD